jgi:hypothetical protein
MFRKLYWVTEHVDETGASQIGGVYTSIPDLIRHGLKHPSDHSLRLTLTKLDCDSRALGSWQSPNFEGLFESLQQYIETDEFSVDQCKALMKAIAEDRDSAAA